MSYGLRNTIILLVVLILFGGGGWAYLQYVQAVEIDSLEAELDEKRTELNEKQQIANQYEDVLKRYKAAESYFQNYDKALYVDNNEEKVFDFINDLNTGNAFTDFTFSFNDSTSEGQYGIIEMDISGSGYYRNFVNFVRKIELSTPVNKISNLTITPVNELEEYGRVDYSFVLESFYTRSQIIENPTFEITSSTLSSLYNPFYPLIRTQLQPNESSLVNIEQSNVVAISGDRVFVVDQTGSFQRLSVGDEVYMGTLTSINLDQRSATFRLNKGGIIEIVTLEVNNNEKEDVNN